MKKIILCMLCVLICAGLTSGMYQAQEAENIMPVTVTQETDGQPSADTGVRTLVDENESFRFEFDEEALNIFVTDKRNGVVFSNEISQEYYQNPEAVPSFISHFMSVSVANSKGDLSQHILYNKAANSAKVNIKTTYADKKAVVTVDIKNTGVSFDFVMWIDRYGFNYSIPDASIKETDIYMLTGVTPLTGFGAVRSDEDGYLFYPDGSGALIEFEKEDPETPRLYTFPVYGTNLQDIRLMQENDGQDIYNLSLPVYGISRQNNGLLAAITEGEADSTVCISPGGYQLTQLNRAYFTFTYRNYVNQKIEGKDFLQLVPYLHKSTRTVKLFLLEDSQKDYSGMAGVYRDFLYEEKLLIKQETSQTVPVAVDLFMGATEKGFFGDKFLKATTYEQAHDIYKALKEAGVDQIQSVLYAWNKGGYDALPTPLSAESKLGGKSGLRSLFDYAAQNDVGLYLDINAVNAAKGQRGYNSKNDVIRNYMGDIIEYKEQYLLNPVKVLQGMIDRAFQKLSLPKGVSLHMAQAGKTVYYDYAKSAPTSRQKTAGSYSEGLAKIKETTGYAAAEGGNLHVLPYVDRLTGIPDSSSEYFINSSPVPFYQMVVHGSVLYTSVHGNQSHDFEYQKLKWIEYGCMPSFLLTWENPVLLKNSSYTGLFSSAFSVWKDRVVETYEEFNDKNGLGGYRGESMLRHERLTRDIVKITYENGSVIYLNYGDATEIAGRSIESMGYFVERG